MKRPFVLLAALAFICVGTVVHASPVTIQLSRAASSVILTGEKDCQLLGCTTLTAQLSSTLDSTAFSLGDNQHSTFDFFTLTVKGSGLLAFGDAGVSATLGFVQPSVPGAKASGSAWWGTIGGVVSGGVLQWDRTTLPDLIALSDGNVLSVNFGDVVALGFGDTATVHATVTNLGGATPVPEPASMLLLGSGLIGLAGMVRRKKRQ